MDPLVVATDGHFAEAPENAFVRAKHSVVWCRSRTLAGLALWGRPDERELARAFALFRDVRADLGTQRDAVLDLRKLNIVDPALYEALAREVRATWPGSAEVQRVAVVHPPGVEGAATVGLFTTLGAGLDWRAFESMQPAFAWLARRDAADVFHQVNLFVSTAMGGLLLPRLRDHLARSPGSSVGDAAHALGISMRSLQRRLKAIGTSFREQVGEARIEIVIDRLIRTDQQLDAIAREVGCSSTAHLSLVFRRSTGETPRRYRRRFLERTPRV